VRPEIPDSGVHRQVADAIKLLLSQHFDIQASIFIQNETQRRIQ